MPQTPSISIVTPSWQAAGTIRDTIRSVLDQKYPNLEYIIIDGGSSDGTAEIIKEHDTQLSYWVSEPDGGMYAAIEKGFARSGGEIMGWLNADDIYLPGALKAAGEIFQCFPDVNWICALNEAVLEDTGALVAVNRLPGFSYEAFCDGLYLGGDGIGWLPQASMFWRRNLWTRVGNFDRSLRLAADFDLWLKFYKFTALYGIDTIWSGFRVRRGQLSEGVSYENEAKSIWRERAEFSARSSGRTLRFTPRAIRLALNAIMNGQPLPIETAYSGSVVVAEHQAGKFIWKKTERTFRHVKTILWSDLFRKE